MNQEQFQIFLTVLFSGLCGMILYFVYRRVRDVSEIRKLKKDLSLSLTESLELATTEQLQTETRKRSFPYIVLCPISEETRSGLTIEVHNVTPSAALGMLKMATMITTKEMKQHGVEMPELPDFMDDDDE